MDKQYSYSKGIQELDEIGQLKLELKRKDAEIDVLKSTRNYKGVGARDCSRIS